MTELKKFAEKVGIPLEMLVTESVSDAEKLDFFDAGKAWARYLNLILVCIKFGADADGKITKTKLAKLVYLCDFASYYHFLKPISGFPYKKLPQGPVATEFFYLIDTNDAVQINSQGKALMVSLNEAPDDSCFTSKELALIKKICSKWRGKKTAEIVAFTHQQIPWQVCRENEVIPYQLINTEEPENVY